jgi:hypothetical protein
VYNTANREKTARAEEFSAIKRGVSRDNVVIADCPNYIKGYRYQLWCEAKAASTRCCVVHVAAQEQECRRWNEERLRAYGREDELEEQETKQEEDGGKAGKDIRGELVPESHTAIYGDRSTDQSLRTHSATPEEVPNRPQAEDTMTLKSLYISSPDNGSERPSVRNGATDEPQESYLPSTQPADPSTRPPYSPTTLTSLSMRYEPPSPFSRWDTPLFIIPTTDTHPPYAAIFDAIFPPPTKPTSKKALSQLPSSARSNGTVASATPHASSTSQPSPSASNDNDPHTIPADTVRPHAATVLPTRTSASALQLLESSTLLVIRSLLSAARAASAADGDGGVVTFSVIPLSSTTATASPTSNPEPSQTTRSEETTNYTIMIRSGTTLTQPLLQQLRRKYTALQRGRIAHGQGYVGASGGERGREEIVEGFVRFLDSEFGDEDG